MKEKITKYTVMSNEMKKLLCKIFGHNIACHCPLVSKGGYCAVCTGLLDNGACTQHEKHEKKLYEKIKEAEQALITKIEEWVKTKKPKEFVFLKTAEHLDCQDGNNFCRECNTGMMSEVRRYTLSDLQNCLKKLKK